MFESRKGIAKQFPVSVETFVA